MEVVVDVVVGIGGVGSGGGGLGLSPSVLWQTHLQFYLGRPQH